MKKHLFFLATVLIIASCNGNKSENASNQENEKDVTTVEEVASQADSIKELEAVAFEDPANPPYVDLGENNKLYIETKGVVAFDQKTLDSGRYTKDGDAYIMFWGMGDVPSTLAVILGDTYYEIYDRTEEGGEQFDDLSFYFDSNLFAEENPFKGVVTYDPSTESISYSVENFKGNIRLSSIPESNQRKVNWAPGK